jgi:hypothetical protein
MSSFSARFKFDGKEFEVLSCNYSFNQLTDDKGRPASDVRAGHISLTLSAAEDQKLLDWMADPDKQGKGSIVFYKIDQASTLKEVKFEEAYCVGFSEHFTANTPDGMTATIEITARKISIGDVNYEKQWGAYAGS